jgi:hypothetical protein
MDQASNRVEPGRRCRPGARSFSVRETSLRVRLLVLSAFVAAVPIGLGRASASASASKGVAARTIVLHESGVLRLTSHHGLTLNEQGTASGTIRGTIYIHLNVVSTNRITAEVNIYPNGGSLTGNASASYRPAGAVASFSGTMTVSRGTGSYGHAHGSGLTFTGAIQRSNDLVTVKMTGSLSV